MRRAVVAAVCVLLAVVGVGLSVAQAAVVPLRAGSLTAFVASDRCTAATLDVRPGTVSPSGTSSQVVLTALPAACLGRPFVLRVHGPRAALGAADTAGVLPASGTTATVAVPPYEVRAVAGVALTVSTWGTRTAWSASSPGLTCRVPGDPAAVCSAVVVSADKDQPDLYRRRVEITSPSPVPVPWEITFDLSSTAQFPFLAAAFHDVQGGLVLVSTSGCAATPRTVTVRGTAAWGSYGTVESGRTERLEVTGSTRGDGSLLTCR